MPEKTDDTPVVDDSNVRRNLTTESVSESQGPQVYTPEQLPDPAVLKAAGLPPLVGVDVIEGDDAYSHPRGPEPGEQVRAEQRRAVIDRVIQNDDVPGVATNELSKAAVEEKPTTALGKALQKRRDSDDVERDEAGRPIDPEGVQEDSNELAEKKGMNEGDGEQLPPETAAEAKKAEKGDGKTSKG